MNAIRVSNIKSSVGMKGFLFNLRSETVYKTPDGRSLDLSESAGEVYVNYAEAQYRLRQFGMIDSDLHDLSIYLSRLIDNKDTTNAISYDLHHPIWKAFQKLLEKYGDFVQAKSELKELLDPVIDTQTGEVIPEDTLEDNLANDDNLKTAIKSC